MKTYNRITPEGMRDLLFEECSARRAVEQKLKTVFLERSYNEVVTPSLEYFDVFSTKSAGIPAELMYKLTDNKGRIMALRPDSTMPIARLTATRLQNAAFPLRLFYTQRVYRNNPGLTGRSDETVQAGIELIGVAGKRADLEVITTAVEALEQCVGDFRLELGHAGYFKRIAEQLPVDENTVEEIRTCIENKNYTALDQMLGDLPPSEAVTAMKKLPRLFGGVEVLEEAAALFSDERSAAMLSYLREMFGHLSSLGLRDKLIIDLGLVQRNDYYTDLIFQGYTSGSGEAVLSGGRYDNLLAQFGAPSPAVGFGINVDILTKIALTETPPTSQAIDVLVHGVNGYEIAAFEQLKILLHEGLRCEHSVLDSEESAKEYALERGIARLDVVSDVVRTINLK